MSILNYEFNFKQVISWGAANTLGSKFIKEMFDKKDAYSISELLESRVHPHFKCWMLLREQLLTPGILHEVAQDFALEYLGTQKQKGTYIDFRTDRLIASKQKWNSAEISTGILSVNKNTAKEIEQTVAELDDADASHLAFM